MEWVERFRDPYHFKAVHEKVRENGYGLADPEKTVSIMPRI
jgi:hypothetical protein